MVPGVCDQASDIFKVIREWNNLPNQTKASNRAEQHKMKTKQYLVNEEAEREGSVLFSSINKSIYLL